MKEIIEEYILCDGDFAEFYKKTYNSKLCSRDEEKELKVDMIPKAITKYILDNVIEFIEYCDNRQVRIINEIRKNFSREAEYATMKLEKISEENNERVRYEKEKYAYEQNINMGQIGYGIHIVMIRELIKPLKQFMEENSQRALPEIIENYKMICQIHGILEKKMEEEDDESEKTLEQLEQELQKLQKQDKRISQQKHASKLLKNAYEMELNKKDEDI
jgi:hypothetical protein